MTTYVRTRNIRAGGDDTRCACPLCCMDITLREESFSEWMQCPSCSMVGHSSCIRRCVLAGDGNIFYCPTCRAPYDKEYMLTDPCAWSAVDLQQNIRSEREDCEYKAPDQHVMPIDRRLRSSGTIKETRSLRSRLIIL